MSLLMSVLGLSGVMDGDSLRTRVEALDEDLLFVVVLGSGSLNSSLGEGVVLDLSSELASYKRQIAART
jgi:hypothetical protein